jgi:hypothetical protein
VTAVFASRTRGRALLAATTAPRHRARGVGPGSSARLLAKRFPHAVALASRAGSRRALLLASRRSRVVFGLRGRRVVFVAVADRALLRDPRTLRRGLRDAGLPAP